MSADEEEKKIFAANLNYYMDRAGKNQSDLIVDLGVNKSTISTWCNGTKMPRMGTVQTLADYFGIRKSDLIEDRSAIVKELPDQIGIDSEGNISAAGLPPEAVEKIKDYVDMIKKLYLDDK